MTNEPVANISHNTSGIWALILAAGQSRRMVDSDGNNHNKLLKIAKGKPLLAYTVDNVANSNINNIVMVTGQRDNEIRAYFNTPEVANITIVRNENYKQGIASSLKAGLTAIDSNNHMASGKCQAIVVIPGDMPLINPTTINRIIDAFVTSRLKENPIIIPYYNNQRGNPVLWPQYYFNAIKALIGDKGASQLLMANKRHLLKLVVDDPGVIFDVDDNQQFMTFNQIITG